MTALLNFLVGLAVVGLAVKLNNDGYDVLLVFAVAGLGAAVLLILVPMAIGEDNMEEDA